MKKVALFVFLVSLTVLFSCSESEECACVRATAQELKESRENGYKKPSTSNWELTNCANETLDKKSSNKQSQELKSCEAYDDLKRERKLFKEFTQDRFEKSMPKFN